MSPCFLHEASVHLAGFSDNCSGSEANFVRFKCASDQPTDKRLNFTFRQIRDKQGNLVEKEKRSRQDRSLLSSCQHEHLDVKSEPKHRTHSSDLEQKVGASSEGQMIASDCR